MNALRVRVILPLMALLCVPVVGCDPGHSLIGREVISLQQRSLPPGGSMSSSDFQQRAPISAAAEWQLEIDWDWPRYEHWVKERFERDFDSFSRGVGQVTLTRWMGESTQTLRFEMLSPESPVRIHVTFISRPS